MPYDGRHVFVFREAKRFHAIIPVAGCEQILGVVRHSEQMTVHNDGRMIRSRSHWIRVRVFFGPGKLKINYEKVTWGTLDCCKLYLSKTCDWSTSRVNPLLECLSYGNHECRPIKELSQTVTNVLSVMKVWNSPLDPDRGGLKNTIGCLLSVIC